MPFHGTFSSITVSFPHLPPSVLAHPRLIEHPRDCSGDLLQQSFSQRYISISATIQLSEKYQVVTHTPMQHCVTCLTWRLPTTTIAPCHFLILSTNLKTLTMPLKRTFPIDMASLPTRSSLHTHTHNLPHRDTEKQNPSSDPQGKTP